MAGHLAVCILGVARQLDDSAVERGPSQLRIPRRRGGPSDGLDR
ncbi:hypothetical protein [Brevibacterium linens]